MSDLPPNQFTILLHFDTSPEHHEWIVGDVLTIFDLEPTECELNDYIYPMRTSQQRMLCPAIESMEGFWTLRKTDLVRMDCKFPSQLCAPKLNMTC